MFVKLLGEWQTVFCSVLSGSILFAQACLSEYEEYVRQYDQIEPHSEILLDVHL